MIWLLMKMLFAGVFLILSVVAAVMVMVFIIFILGGLTYELIEWAKRCSDGGEMKEGEGEELENLIEDRDVEAGAKRAGNMNLDDGDGDGEGKEEVEGKEGL